MTAVGSLFAALGWVMSTDFRGFATWHTQTTMRMMAPFQRAVSRVPPWRWMNLDPEVTMRRQLRLGKFIGAVFLVFGALFALSLAASASCSSGTDAILSGCRLVSGGALAEPRRPRTR
jgi:hypothetical protein